MENMRPIFKTEILIYQPKDNLDEKILVVKITYNLKGQGHVTVNKLVISTIYIVAHTRFW